MDEHCPLDSIQPYTLAHQLFNTSDMRLDSIQPYTGTTRLDVSRTLPYLMVHFHLHHPSLNV
jgi:acid phosphatase class B